MGHLAPEIDEDPPVLNRLPILLLLTAVVTGCAHRGPVVSNVQSPAALLRAAAANTAVVDDDDAVMAGVNLLGPAPQGVLVKAHAGLRAGAAPKPAIISMPSPNKNDRPGDGKIDTLIMHHTSSAASAERIGGFFSKKESKVSAHFTVGKDGHIVQSVDEAQSAWHAGVSSFDGRANVNGFSIGIEMCNVGDGADPYTDDQYKALGQLVAYILTNYNIKWARVTGHKDVALPKGRKDDPSLNFSYARFKQEVLAVDPHAGM
ncbi:MAG: ampD [Cyanobacteria bacterium RYN_339]|nr:ampD [Cyanobacteria bacterium RYN_339]